LIQTRIDTIIREEGSHEWDTGVTNLPEWEQTAVEELEAILAALEPAEAGGVEATEEAPMTAYLRRLDRALQLPPVAVADRANTAPRDDLRLTLDTTAPVDALVKLRAELIDHGYAPAGKLIGYVDAALDAIREGRT